MFVFFNKFIPSSLPADRVLSFVLPNNFFGSIVKMDSFEMARSKWTVSIFVIQKSPQLSILVIVEGGGGEGIPFAIFRIRILGDLEDLS